MSDRIFTPEEANALLPRLREELRGLQEMTDEYEERMIALRKKRAEAGTRTGGGAAGGDDPFFEEEGRLDFMRMEIEMAIGNFGRHGVLLKMIHPGLIDFPALVNGEAALICWKEGEERATHYHGWEDGFAGRRPLPSE